MRWTPSGATSSACTVDSQPGCGTTFELYLPVYEEATSESEVVVDSAIPS